MRSRTTRLSEIAAVTAVSLILLGPAPSRAQSAPGPAASQIPMAPYDPPARVGRLARISGTVSFHTADQDHWEPATLNYPITSGNSLWTEPGASAQVEVASSRIVLAPRTELDVDTIGDHAMTMTAPQGETYLRLRDLPAGDTVVVRTPRGLVTITQPGRYGIVAGDTDHPTMVTVAAGLAQITGDNLSLQVGANQTATLVGADNFTGTVGPEVTDEFLRAQLAAEGPAPRAGTPAEITLMTGAEALATEGEWASTPDYGDVWYPPVDREWVPYRDGNWAYVAPWGWTWVAAEPWGFAPSHYGRWVEVGSRWGWTPERNGRFGMAGPPVYAPALVRWLNVPSRGRAGAGMDRPVGWIPLGPRERFVPWYRSSQAYARGVNRTDATNVTRIDNFANRRGATMAPMTAVASSQHIGQHVDTAALASARTSAVPGLRPNAATVGVTPAMARRVRLDPAPAGVAARPPGPGPAFQTRTTGMAANRPGSRPAGVAPMQPVAEPAGAPAQANVPGQGPQVAGPGRGPNAAAIVGGAAVGGAVVGGAALINRQGHHEQLPALASPRGPGANGPSAPGGAPGPAVMPRAENPGGGPVGGLRAQPGSAQSPLAGGPAAPANGRQETGPGAPHDTRIPGGQLGLPHLAGPAGSPGQPGSQPVTHPTPGPAGSPRAEGQSPGAPPGQVAPPAHVQAAPSPQGHPAPPPAQAHIQAPPAPQVHQTPPPPQAHIQAPAAPQARPASPPPQVHVQAPPPSQPRPAPPPQVHVQAPPPQARPAPPPPQVHVQAPPPPQVHVQAPPPPQARPAPPPPQVHAQTGPSPAARPAPPSAPAGHGGGCPPGKHC